MFMNVLSFEIHTLRVHVYMTNRSVALIAVSFLYSLTRPWASQKEFVRRASSSVIVRINAGVISGKLN